MYELAQSLFNRFFSIFSTAYIMLASQFRLVPYLRCMTWSILKCVLITNKRLNPLHTHVCGNRVTSQATFDVTMATRSLSSGIKRGDNLSQHSETRDGVDVLNDPRYCEFVESYFSIPGAGQRVLVIQPDDRSISPRHKLTTAQLQLDEACALIDTLQNWTIINKVIINTRQVGSKQMFGRGNLERIQAILSLSPGLTCIFMAVNVLTSVQLTYLTCKLGLPVYDRYTIVLQIFKENAKTKVAKLQVALAEVPYMRSRLQGLHSGTVFLPSQGCVSKVVRHGEKFMDVQHQVLQDRETKLKKALEKLRKQRQLLRKGRTKLDIPIVAIVGYTNGGKTTLIKALTGDDSLEPRNQLFATLDVTVHAGVLPSKLTVLYVDTVGFISDIPVSLIDAFRATLEDALVADVVVHVRDVSHPDTDAQRQNVITTLTSLLPRQHLDDMLEVCNKVDLLPRDRCTCRGTHEISAVTGEGLSQLQSTIEQAVIRATDLQQRGFKIPANGQHLSWLYKYCTVLDVSTDNNGDNNSDNNLVVNVLINEKSYARFKSAFSPAKQKHSTTNCWP